MHQRRWFLACGGVILSPFDSLLHKIVKILIADELFYLPPSMIVLIPRVGMRRTDLFRME